jgi:hypothetical protein
MQVRIGCPVAQPRVGTALSAHRSKPSFEDDEASPLCPVDEDPVLPLDVVDDASLFGHVMDQCGDEPAASHTKSGWPSRQPIVGMAIEPQGLELEPDEPWFVSLGHDMSHLGGVVLVSQFSTVGPEAHASCGTGMSAQGLVAPLPELLPSVAPMSCELAPTGTGEDEQAARPAIAKAVERRVRWASMVTPGLPGRPAVEGNEGRGTMK